MSCYNAVIAGRRLGVSRIAMSLIMNFSFDAFLNLIVILVIVLSLLSKNTRLIYRKLLSSRKIKDRDVRIIIVLSVFLILELLIFFSNKIQSEGAKFLLIYIIPLTLFIIVAFFVKALVSDSSR